VEHRGHHRRATRFIVHPHQDHWPHTASRLGRNPRRTSSTTAGRDAPAPVGPSRWWRPPLRTSPLRNERPHRRWASRPEVHRSLGRSPDLWPRAHPRSFRRDDGPRSRLYGSSPSCDALPTSCTFSDASLPSNAVSSFKFARPSAVRLLLSVFAPFNDGFSFLKNTSIGSGTGRGFGGGGDGLTHVSPRGASGRWQHSPLDVSCPGRQM
jgi:hypothetical protein